MKKILIMYATFGNGHRAIAKYIEEYFKSRDEEIEIKNIDILSYITPFINKIGICVYYIIEIGNGKHFFSFSFV